MIMKLMFIINRGHLEVLQVLCEYKADFTVHKRETRETVLHRVLAKDPTASSEQNLLVSFII